MAGYENLPFDSGAFLAHQLPGDYIIMNSNQATTHIVHSVWEESDKDRHMTVCGNWAKYKVSKDSIPGNWLCASCMQVMNCRMEGYMFDEENEEYYDPTNFNER